MIHALKTWPEYFEKVKSGEKNFELRKNDRHFQVGDTLILQEWDSISGYSGRECDRVVSYVFNGGGTMGLQEGYVIMSLTL